MNDFHRRMRAEAKEKLDRVRVRKVDVGMDIQKIKSHISVCEERQAKIQEEQEALAYLASVCKERQAKILEEEQEALAYLASVDVLIRSDSDA